MLIHPAPIAGLPQEPPSCRTYVAVSSHCTDPMRLSVCLQSFIAAIRSGRAGDVEAMLSSGAVDSTSGTEAPPG